MKQLCLHLRTSGVKLSLVCLFIFQLSSAVLGAGSERKSHLKAQYHGTASTWTWTVIPVRISTLDVALCLIVQKTITRQAATDGGGRSRPKSKSREMMRGSKNFSTVFGGSFWWLVHAWSHSWTATTMRREHYPKLDGWTCRTSKLDNSRGFIGKSFLFWRRFL